MTHVSKYWQLTCYVPGILNVTQATVMVDLVGIERVAPANGILSFFVGTSVLVASPVSGMYS